MADLSAETQAIIGELDRQGKLLRNDGRTNSIKSVRQDLAKFEPIFASMNTGIGNIAEKINAMVSLSKDELEGVSNVATDDLDDEYVALQKEAAELTIKNANQREKLEAERMARDEVARKQKEKDDRKAEKENNKIMKQGLISMARDNKMGMMKGVLKYGLLGFAGFNILKGIIDQTFDGAASEFLNGVDWTSLSEGFNEMTSWITSDIWKTLATGLAAWGALEFGLPFMVNTAGELIKLSAFKSALSGITGDDIKKTGGFPGLRVGIAGALGTALALGMPAIKNYIRKNMKGMTDAEIENAKADPGVLDAAGYAAIGGTFGMMFGPKGALVGSIIGFSIGLGAMLIDNLKDDVNKAGATDEVQEVTDSISRLQERVKKIQEIRELYIGQGLEGEELEEKMAQYANEEGNLYNQIRDEKIRLGDLLKSTSEQYGQLAEDYENRLPSDKKLFEYGTQFAEGAAGRMAPITYVDTTIDEKLAERDRNMAEAERLRGKIDADAQIAAMVGFDMEEAERLKKEKEAAEQARFNSMGPYNSETRQLNMTDETSKDLVNRAQSSEQVASISSMPVVIQNITNKGGDTFNSTRGGDTVNKSVAFNGKYGTPMSEPMGLA